METFYNFEIWFWTFLVVFTLIFAINFFRQCDVSLIDYSLDSLQSQYDNGEISKEKFDQIKKFINDEFEPIKNFIN